MSSQLNELNQWIHTYATLTEADTIHWCNGSDAENAALVALMLKNGDFIALNPQTHPNCFLHRSSPSDVARVEHLTFRLYCKPRRCRSEQPLDGSDDSKSQNGRAVQGLHERPHSVCRAVLHGPD